jgi:hypothetical protein
MQVPWNKRGSTEESLMPIDADVSIDGPGWVAERMARRSFLMRAGGAVAGAIASTSIIRMAFPELAQAACHAGCFCPGVCASCYRRYVCGCQDVHLRYCPGGDVKATLWRNSEFDIQRPPSTVAGYEFGYGYAVANGRGWALASCLTTYRC